jgi:hypothetical protein
MLWSFRPGAKYDCTIVSDRVCAMQKRRRIKQQLTLQDRLIAWSKEILAQAAALPPGPERDALVKKARQAELASHVDDWATAPT